MSLMMVLIRIIYFFYAGQKEIAIIDMHLELMKKAQTYILPTAVLFYYKIPSGVVFGI